MAKAGPGAVVRARYGGSAGKTAKAINYYTQRPDDEHIPQAERTGFSRDQDELSRGEMQGVALEQDPQKRYGYELVLSPPPTEGKSLTNEDLQSWAKGVMVNLEARRGEDLKWVAVVHEHKEHPHVHVMAWTNQRLDRGDLNAMRENAAKSLREGYSYRSSLKPEHSFASSLKRERTQEQTGSSRGVKSSGAEKEMEDSKAKSQRRVRGMGME